MLSAWPYPDKDLIWGSIGVCIVGRLPQVVRIHTYIHTYGYRVRTDKWPLLLVHATVRGFEPKRWRRLPLLHQSAHTTQTTPPMPRQASPPPFQCPPWPLCLPHIDSPLTHLPCKRATLGKGRDVCPSRIEASWTDYYIYICTYIHGRMHPARGSLWFRREKGVCRVSGLEPASPPPYRHLLVGVCLHE